jgi:hypothetical protein
MYMWRDVSIATSCYIWWRQIAREGPVEGASYEARELLQWAKKEVGRRGYDLQFSDGVFAEVPF